MILRSSSSSRIRASNITNEYPLPPHEKKRKRASAAAANNKKPHLEKVRNEDISSYNLEKGPDRQLLDDLAILPAANGLCKCKVCDVRISKTTVMVGVKSFFKLRGCTFPSMSWVHPLCGLRFASTVSLIGDSKRATTRKCKRCEAILCKRYENEDNDRGDGIDASPLVTVQATLCILVQLQKSRHYFCVKCLYDSASPECRDRDRNAEENYSHGDSVDKRVNLGIPCEEISDFPSLNPELQSVARKMFH